MRSGWVWVATSALAGSTLALSVAPAAADWQYAQWGMNPDQVVAASNEAAQPSLDRSLDIGDLRAALTAPYRIGSVPLMAVFLFDPKSKLQVVTLKPGSGDLCPKIVETLGAHHGTPDRADDMVQARTLRWDDTDDDNLIVYADLGRGDCTVQYSKLPPTRPDGKGL